MDKTKPNTFIIGRRSLFALHRGKLGEFYNYIKTFVRNQLYGQQNFFEKLQRKLKEW